MREGKTHMSCCPFIGTSYLPLLAEWEIEVSCNRAKKLNFHHYILVRGTPGKWNQSWMSVLMIFCDGWERASVLLTEKTLIPSSSASKLSSDNAHDAVRCPEGSVLEWLWLDDDADEREISIWETQLTTKGGWKNCALEPQRARGRPKVWPGPTQLSSPDPLTAFWVYLDWFFLKFKYPHLKWLYKWDASTGCILIYLKKTPLTDIWSYLSSYSATWTAVNCLMKLVLREWDKLNNRLAKQLNTIHILLSFYPS